MITAKLPSISAAPRNASYHSAGSIVAVSQATKNLLQHLAGRPGHDEVKADFRQLLVEEFGVELGALDFERRVPKCVVGSMR
jgi:hypothetical protein